MKQSTIIISVVVLLLALGGAGTWYYYSSPSADSDAAEGAQTPHPASGGDREEAHYLALEPPFIVNFVYQDTLRYLQLTLSLMSHDPEVIEQAKHHMPAIRHYLIMLLSDKSFAELAGKENREQLRGEMLRAVRGILETEQYKGRPGSQLDAVYFTGYVMQ